MSWNQRERFVGNALNATGPSFYLRGGEYGVFVSGTTIGTVTLNRLAADGVTLVPVLAAFTAAGFASVNLPDGQYTMTLSGSTAVTWEVVSVVTAI